MWKKLIKYEGRKDETADEIFSRRLTELLEWYYREMHRANIKRGIANAKRKQG